MDNQKRINEFADKLNDVCSSFNDLAAHEIGFRLIEIGVKGLLFCAPDNSAAMKIIKSAIQTGIEEHQNHKGK